MTLIALCAMPTKIARTFVNTIGITGWKKLHLEIVGSLELEEFMFVPVVRFWMKPTFLWNFTEWLSRTSFLTLRMGS